MMKIQSIQQNFKLICDFKTNLCKSSYAYLCVTPKINLISIIYNNTLLKATIIVTFSFFFFTLSNQGSDMPLLSRWRCRKKLISKERKWRWLILTRLLISASALSEYIVSSPAIYHFLAFWVFKLIYFTFTH